MDSTCETCHGRMPETTDRYICEACQYRIHTYLREIARSLPLLRDLLRPDTGPAQRGGTGRAHAPLPVRLETLDLLGPGAAVQFEDPEGDQTGGIPIGALLYGWAQYLASEIPAVRRDEHGTIRIQPCTGAWSSRGTSITAWCTWLDAYLPYAATRPWVESMDDQLEDLVRRIRRITHTKPRTTPMDAPCPGCTAFALVEREDEWHISCQACDVRLTPDQYTEHRTQIMPTLAALALRIAAARQTAA